MSGVLLLNTAILALTLVSPFIALYAVKFIKKGALAKHQLWQRSLFIVCMIALIVLEMQIRYSGGSGSIVKHSSYYGTTLFKTILFAHIIGAVLTYIIWGYLVIISTIKARKKECLPGNFSKTHRLLGKLTIFGLFYTAATALYVYLTTFIL
jgi:putative membrane protein